MYQEVSGPPAHWLCEAVNHAGINCSKLWNFLRVFLRVPIPSLKHSVQQREVHIEKKVNVDTDFLQLSSADWNWALSGQGLYWGSCFHGLPRPLCTAFTLLAKEKGSWYDTCRFFTDTLLWKLGQTSAASVMRDSNKICHSIKAQSAATGPCFVKRCVREKLWGEYLQSKSYFKSTKKYWCLKKPYDGF